MEHTVEACPSWAEHRRYFIELNGGSNLSLPALVEAMVQGGPLVWEVVESFCEAVLLAKEVADHEWEQLATDSRLHRRRRDLFDDFPRAQKKEEKP